MIFQPTANSSPSFPISLLSLPCLIISKTLLWTWTRPRPRATCATSFPRVFPLRCFFHPRVVSRSLAWNCTSWYIYKFSTILYVIRIYRAERQGWLLYGDLPKRGRCTCSKRIRGYLVTSGSPRLKIGKRGADFVSRALSSSLTRSPPPELGFLALPPSSESRIRSFSIGTTGIPRDRSLLLSLFLPSVLSQDDASVVR